MHVNVTNHAYEQYCIRVASITYRDLLDRLAEQLPNVEHRHRQYIKLGGVWWVYIDRVFVTCLGRSDLDLPAAIEWAARNNDRIVLGDRRG